MNEIISEKLMNDNLLLNDFNNREERAFEKIYNLYFYEFFHFTNKLFEDTIEMSEDVVQEIFINVWDNKKQRFDSLNGLKLYIYVCIKNRFRNYIRHKNHIKKYNNSLDLEEYFTVEMAESEVYSIIAESISLLPEECATVFKLNIDGWSVKDIAKKLQKTESTIYKQKTRSIEIIKERFLGHSKKTKY